MSKEDAKKKQGWVAKPTPRCCGNCKHLLLVEDWARWIKENHTEEELQGIAKSVSSMTCQRGGFKTGKTSLCNEWEAT